MFPLTMQFSPADAAKRVSVNGYVADGFEGVRQVFAENFTRRHELGGACCAYYRGQKVVDLWGGIRNKKTGEPWKEDTMVIMYSATKGLAAMTIALAHSRGWLDFERTVASYTVRMRSPFGNCSHTRPGCLRWTNR
jgi:CubicO group peptidase (beta-lactamase class C family)